jgi:hypothetical protein
LQAGGRRFDTVHLHQRLTIVAVGTEITARAFGLDAQASFVVCGLCLRVRTKACSLNRESGFGASARICCMSDRTRSRDRIPAAGLFRSVSERLDVHCASVWIFGMFLAFRGERRHLDGDRSSGESSKIRWVAGWMVPVQGGIGFFGAMIARR